MSLSLFDQNKKLQEKAKDAFFNALSRIYVSILVLDLTSLDASVLCAGNDEEIVGREMPWSEVLERFVGRCVYEKDRSHITELFSAESLNRLLENQVGELNAEARCRLSGSESYEWLEIMAAVFDHETRQILVTTRKLSEEKLHKHVLDRFLYHQNCDFLILVNLGDNSYKSFDVGTGLLPVPGVGSADYIADMVSFNERYIVKSEMDRVISLMMPENIEKKLLHRDEYTFTCGVTMDSGEYRRARMQLIVFDRAKRLVIISRSDITQIYLEDKRMNEQLLHALRVAQRDQLTDLYNQITTEKIISQMLENYQGELAAFLFIDVDNFKMVNDTLGHLRGNEVLKSIADYLKEMTTKDFIAGRVGGDEFLVFLSGVTCTTEVCEKGRQICKAFESLKTLTEGLPISCSVGISIYPQDGLNYEVLVRKADQALYRAKRYGKNNYSLYSDDMEHFQYSSALSEID